MIIIKKQTIFIDFDNTLVNSTKKICSLYNEDYSYYKDFKVAKWYECSDWNFQNICTLANVDVINNYFNQPRFFKNLEYMDYALEVIKQLHSEYKLVIISIGNYANLELKRRWIKGNLKEYIDDFIGLNFDEYSDKSAIDMTGNILIDDNSSFLETSSASTKICFGDVYDWNKIWDDDRCFNWQDVFRKLM